MMVNVKEKKGCGPCAAKSREEVTTVASLCFHNNVHVDHDPDHVSKHQARSTLRRCVALGIVWLEALEATEESK